MKIRWVFLFILIIAASARVTADVTQSNGTGGGLWTTGSSWNGGSVPVNGDTVVILAGDTITISGNLYFNGVIQVYGVLLLDNGRLNMDEDSVIQFAEGSNILTAGNPANNSISIGGLGNQIRTSDILTLAIPNQLTYESILLGSGCAETGVCDDNPLPVEILYFTAAPMGAGVHLEWATIKEENFDYFTLERAADGKQFHALAKIFSENGFSNSKREYAFYDEMPLAGYSFYRLKTTDFDGYTEYHGVVSIRMDEIREAVRIFPNPVHGNQVKINFSGAKTTLFKLVSFTGQTLQTGSLSQGINEIQFRVPLDPGIYFIQLEDVGISPPQKLIIR